MELRASLYRLVHGYRPRGPGVTGLQELAAYMGRHPSVLNKCVAPNGELELRASEVLLLMQLAGNVDPLRVMAAATGQVLLPLPAAPGADAGAPLVRTIGEFGELVAATAEALADGRVTLNELRRIEEEGLQAIAAIQALLAHVAGLRPPPPRTWLQGPEGAA